jgi:hypothetical protein
MIHLRLLILALTLTGLHSFAQDCNCPKSKSCIYHTAILSVCGNVLDSAGTEKIISEFTVRSGDSLLVDQMHNEGASFLFQKTRTILVITEIDLEIRDGKYIHPEKFSRTVVQLVKGKPVVFHSKVEAVPLVARLRKDFKKTTELY